MPSSDARYIVGIDLGTTNIVVSFCDLLDEQHEIKIFHIPQFVAPGEIAFKDTLPAFCYFPNKKMLEEKQFVLPWEEQPNYVIGFHARNSGAESPSHFISSVKSWLCHPGVDRRGKILPWGISDDTCLKVSPLEVTANYLAHIRQAWDTKFSSQKTSDNNPCLLANQHLIITVPASFDESARELTLEAAKLAGLPDVILIEEPLAAFYAWLYHNSSNWREKIHPGEKILIIDVGGGTTDFSIIGLDSDGVLSRIAAGDHLLLGGDNMDMAIAKEIEKKWNTHLSQSEWIQLCQRAREAKEKIFNENLGTVEFAVFSRGSSVIASTKKAQITIDELDKILINGFFPKIPVDSPRAKIGSGIRSMGLPYVAEPSITNHLLDFLRDAAIAQSPENNFPICPDKVLFNGGVFHAEILRKSIIHVLQQWFPNKEIEEISGTNYTLAVSTGAVYFGIARQGKGVKIKSGTSRAYFIQTDFYNGNEKRYVCVMPRGIDENERQTIAGTFILKANRKVVFPLYSRVSGPPGVTGEIISFSEELHHVSELVSFIRHGDGEEKEFPCSLSAELSETGILKIWLENRSGSESWPLHFDIRVTPSKTSQKNTRNIEVIDKQKIELAKQKIIESFPANRNADDFSLLKEIEKILGAPRNEWNIFVLREFADVLIDKVPIENLSIPNLGPRWLAATGYCLRPGFGEPEDENRIKKVWKIWYDGLRRPNDARTVCEWWIFWRRIAPGLSAGHHKTIAQTLIKLICPKNIPVKNVKWGSHAKAEMWRCLAVLELLPASTKCSIAEALAEQPGNLCDFECWALSRLAARNLFRAGAEFVISAESASKICDKLMSVSNPSLHALFALSRIASLCGDRTLDIPEPKRSEVKKFLERHKAPSHWIQHLEANIKDSEEETCALIGESLPRGLVLLPSS